jgi:hypothetical protein
VIARRPSGAEYPSGSAAPGAGTSGDILQRDNLHAALSVLTEFSA